MTELEYDIMDELYFVTDYQTLVQSIEMSENELISTLISLLEKEYIDQLQLNNGEFEKRTPNLQQLKSYSYLATKKGLLVHNGME